jgi:hypothetical protein
VLDMLIGSRPVRRSRLVLLLATMVVVAGVLVGLGALWLNPARAAVGPLPAEALVLPADARFVMGIDIPRFTSSAFYKRYAIERGMRPQVLADLEAKTGLDPARDLQQIVLAGSGFGPGSQMLAVALGRFDARKLTRALQTEGKARAYEHEGVTVYAFKGASGPGTAIAVLGSSAVVFGGEERVAAAVASRARGEAPLRSNKTILALVEKVRPGSTFWMVGDQTLLAGLPSAIPGSGAASGSSFNLPALRSLTVTGDLDPLVSLSVTGEAADETAARSLADVVRGLIAIMTLQAQQKPELQQLSSAVTVATEANRVLLSARIPYELLDALQPRPRPVPAPATPGVTK